MTVVLATAAPLRDVCPPKGGRYANAAVDRRAVLRRFRCCAGSGAARVLV
jgi:hypothetical protein